MSVTAGPLPAEGVKEVLIQAAAANPMATLLAVVFVIALSIVVAGLVKVKTKQLEVMKSPEASRAMIEMQKLENAQKRLASKAKKAKS